MLMNKILITIVGTLATMAALAQTPFVSGVAESYSYIGTAEKSEIALKAKITKDDGVVIVGYSTEMDIENPVYDYTKTDMLITKLNASGVVEWSHVIGVNNNLEDMFMSVDVDPLGNVYAVGTTERVPPTFAYNGTYSKACMYKFSLDGNLLWKKNISINNFNSVPQRRGDIYLGVDVMPNGNIVAVGEKDFSPAYSDGIVTIFSSDGAVLANKTFLVDNNSSGFFHVITDNSNNMYVSATRQGTTYMDHQILKLDSDLNIIWSKNADMNYSGSNCQALLDIGLTDNYLYLLNHTGAGYDYANPVSMGLLKVDPATGDIISSEVVYHGNTVAAAQNQGNFFIVDDNNRYVISTPNPARADLYVPNYGINNNIVNKAYISYDDTTIYLSLAGAQTITSMDKVRGKTVFVGIGKNDPEQIGQYDILVVMTENNLPSGINPSHCNVRSGEKGSDDFTQVNSFNYTFDGIMDGQYTLIDIPLSESNQLDQEIVCKRDNTGIDHNNIDGEQVLLYPNPAQEEAIISFYTANGGAVAVDVVNMMGKTVYSRQMKVYSGFVKIALPATDFMPGVYAVRITYNNQQGMVKLIKSE